MKKHWIDELFVEMDKISETYAQEYGSEISRIREAKYVYLFGAGREGTTAADYILAHFPGKEIRFIDNDSTKHNKKIYRDILCYPVSVVTFHNLNDISILISTLGHSSEIYNELVTLGLESRVVPKCSFDQCKRGFVSFVHRDENLEHYFNHKEELRLASSIYTDELSCQTFKKAVLCRITADNDAGDIIILPQYFPVEIKKRLSDKEVFLDIGACLGDTIDSFRDEMENKFRKIYSFEMDRSIYARLCKNTSYHDSRIQLFNVGISDRNGRIEYTHGDCGASSYIIRFNSQCFHQESADLKSIDSLIEDGVINEPITFVKMDIEGAEFDALQGMRRMIQRDTPKLAVCVYHKTEDIWKLPLYIKELVPQYNFILRQHSSCMDWDTVLYVYK